ncbi:Down syndrome critical region protein 3 homolog [Lingula anatina]|uniref:Vacuolar protein sorting-associated protein 26C n=1 Tax=Lingula anatina TaxID=7574 RepID=A0A1S3I9N6_LINAN|nr:Down syndrome critical region protein 3 homolog [Lingula anatina]XP_013394114.1 Down syndrome critical region protein 3 homolog [Lingula anatina]|eukprot:XP_013382522.1 Down syndrome critical region protein 3 homolog [Lingula anatina]
MATLLDVRLKKVNKIYREGDVVAGLVVIQSKDSVQHQGITLTVEGNVGLQLSAKSVGLFEAFYNSLKPIQLLHYNLDIAKPGKLPSGKTEIPFEVPLKPKGNKTLYETYHGVFVNIQYTIKVDMKRSLLNKDLQKQLEFIVEYKEQEEKAKAKVVQFTISPETLQNVKEKVNVPRFKVKGKLDTAVCLITKPFTGELTVESSEAPLKSIELQLVRVETCGCAEGYAKDATEIQNIQIAEGDVCRGISIPIYMVFPRLFTCPTLATNNFKVEFEVNIVIVFQDDRLVTENFPIQLTRF